MTRSDTKQVILTAMHDEGESLVLALELGKPVWRLISSGHRISPRTARRVVNSIDDSSDECSLPYVTSRSR
jgi:hypothetical protein